METRHIIPLIKYGGLTRKVIKRPEMSKPTIRRLIMSLTAALTAAGAVAGGLGSLADIGLGIANYGLQEKAYRADQENLAITRSREDNAIQRRVADLRAAGLSPTLAAGSPAQAAMAPKVTAPQINMKTDFNKAFEGAAMAAQLMQQKADIARTNADIRRTELESAKIQKETAMLDDKSILLKGDVTAQKLALAVNTHDFEYFRKLGIPTSTRGDVLQIATAITALGKAIKDYNLIEAGQKLFEQTKEMAQPVVDAMRPLGDKMISDQEKVDADFAKKHPILQKLWNAIPKAKLPYEIQQKGGK